MILHGYVIDIRGLLQYTKRIKTQSRRTIIIIDVLIPDNEKYYNIFYDYFFPLLIVIVYV